MSVAIAMIALQCPVNRICLCIVTGEMSLNEAQIERLVLSVASNGSTLLYDFICDDEYVIKSIMSNINSEYIKLQVYIYISWYILRTKHLTLRTVVWYTRWSALEWRR